MRYVVGKASKNIGLLRRFRKTLDSLVIQSFYQTCIRPTLEYSLLALSGLSMSDGARLEKTQRVAAQLITNSPVSDHVPADNLLARAGLEPLLFRQQQGLALMTFGLTRPVPQKPPHLVSPFEQWASRSSRSTSSISLRSSLFRLPRPRTEVMRQFPLYGRKFPAHQS